ncbi:MAG: hypothetical protein ACRDBY_14200 [Cetobacterium sp.]
MNNLEVNQALRLLDKHEDRIKYLTNEIRSMVKENQRIMLQISNIVDEENEEVLFNRVVEVRKEINKFRNACKSIVGGIN